MADETIRVALIGAGGNARLRHIPGFQAIDGVEVVAVCNRSEESGRRVADEFEIERVATDPEQIFADDSIDVVCIATWPYRHAEYTVRSLEAGKHVLCEARMAMDATEARAMLAASRARPELAAQLVPAPFDFRSWRTIRRLVREGALGEIRELHCSLLSGQSLSEAPLHWRERRDYSGYNTMRLGILAEVVHRWIGPTERVVADAETFVKRRVDAETGVETEIEIPDSLGVFARMANGARATYLSSTVTPAPRDQAGGISIYGSEAALHWSMGDSMTLAAPGEEPQPLAPDPGAAHDWRVEQDFIDSIREGTPVELTSFEDGVLYMQFVEAVWRSWSGGRPVALAEV